MYGDEHHIVVLIDDFYLLLHLSVLRNAHQSTETSHAMVDMYHIVTNLKLL